MILSIFLLIEIAFKVKKLIILFYFVICFVLLCFCSSLFCADNFTFFKIYLIRKKNNQGVVTYLLIDNSKLKQYF